MAARTCWLSDRRVVAAAAKAVSELAAHRRIAVAGEMVVPHAARRRPASATQSTARMLIER